MQKLNYFFSKAYLFTTIQSSKYESLYLYLSLLLILAPIAIKIFLRVTKKNHPKEIYKTLDSLWFWISFSLGLAGLFVWFSRTQLLPIFSTRFISYLWILLIFVGAGAIFYYYKKNIPGLIEKYYKTTRKKRYLR